MKSVEELREQLAKLDGNIKLGQAFEERGYDCGMMLAFTQAIRNSVAKELEEAEREAGKSV